MRRIPAILIYLKNKKAAGKLAELVTDAGYRPVIAEGGGKFRGRTCQLALTDSPAELNTIGVHEIPFLLVTDSLPAECRKKSGNENLRGFVFTPLRADQIKAALATALLFCETVSGHLRKQAKAIVPASAAQSRIRAMHHEEDAILFDALLAELVSQTGSEYGFVGEVCTGSEGKRFLRPHAVSDLTGDHRFSGFSRKKQKKGAVFYNLENLFGSVMRTGKPVISNSPAADRRSGGTPDGHPPLKSFLGIPLFRESVLIGVVGLANRRGGYRKSTANGIKSYLDTCAGILSAVKNRVEREKAQQELSRQSHFLQTLIDAIPVPIFYKDTDGKYLGCNSAFERMTGNTKSRVVDAESHDLFPRELAEIYTHADRRLVKKPGIINFEAKVVFADKELHDAEVYKATYCDASGAVAGIIGAIFDITSLKSAERKLMHAVKEAEEEKAKSDAVISAIAYAVSIQDRRFRVLLQNEMHRNLTGDHAGEICYRCYADRNKICDTCPVMMTFRDGRVHTIEKISSVLGREAYVEITASPLKDSSGRIVAAIELLRDITERKRVEEELRTSRQRLALHMEQTPLGVVEWDLDFTVREWNPAAERIFGYSRDEALGRHASFIVPEQMKSRVNEVWQRLLSQQGGTRSTNENLTRVGRSIVCEWYNTPLVDGHGRTIGVASLVLDVTERKRAEEEIRESRYWLQEMQRVAQLGSYVYEFESARWTSSEILDSIFGIDLQFERSFENWLSLVHPEERGELSRYFSEVFAASSGFSREYRIQRHCDGAVRWVHGLGKFIYDRSGTLIRMVGTIQDITEQKQRELSLAEKTAQLENLSHMLEAWVTDEVKKNREKDVILIKQSRQAAMGEMINNIAHQWRQPLNSVGMIVQLMEQSYKMNELTPEFVNELVRKAMEIIMFMSHTIDDFRNFFKPEREAMPFSLKDAVKRTVSLIEASFKSNNIEIAIDMDRDAIINGYKNEYSQVLLNLLNNARDVLLERQVTAPRIWLTLALDDNRTRLSVRDNGGGIPEEILDRIFDPYFTTKDQGKGTGIGLYMSKTIIETNMSGKLTVHNTEFGAEFVIEI